MIHEVRGVVALSKGAPVTVETVLVPAPGPGEALVGVQACGVCRTDLHYRQGGINDEFPFLLGHEAAGVVEAVGDGVDTVAPGDFVILNWRAVCGRCRACRRGKPWYCFDTHNAAQSMTLSDGTALTPALGIGAFVEKTLVHSGQCTKVSPAIAPEIAGLLGCGVMAGLGAAINTGGVTRGDSVAVIGCGGVGNAAIAGAALAGATTIIGIDVDPGKLRWATDFGATHTVNAGESDVVEAVRSHTGGFGADVVIDAVGRPDTWRQAFFARDFAGTVVLVGVPTPDLMVPDIPLLEIFGRGGSLKSSRYGDCLPERDFPMLVDLHLQGRLPLEKFVSETITVDDVEAAFEKMERGEVLRSVMLLPKGAQVERVVTSGTFSLDGGTWAVDNNVWLIGDEREVIVVDAAHDAEAIAAAVGDRRVLAIVCTHAHDDHVNAAPELSRILAAPVLLHPKEHVLWRLAHPDTPPPDAELADGDVLRVASTALRVLHTPGHSPGSCCLYAPDLGVVFSGDTLFQGGPGATGRSYSDFDEIVASIRSRLLTLPAETEVRTGHGDSTTVGDEAEHIG